MHRIALMCGDGIGPEIVDAALKVIDATGVEIDWVRLKAGQGAQTKYGTPLPDETLETYLDCGVGFKGPFAVEMDDEMIRPGLRKNAASGQVQRAYNSATNALRREGGGYAAVRLAKSYPGVPAPIPDVDVAIVREISEDLYVASEYTSGDDTAVALKIISRKASEKVARFAFAFAETHGRKLVTAIHKANVLKQSDGLFVRVVREIAEQYPQIAFNERFIDASCALVISNPSLFDVAVMPNQYGDIFSDLCSSAAGSLGLGAGATYGTEACLFEPVHGTAPDIAGKGVANPVSQILSGALMLRYVKEDDAAAAIGKAVEAALTDPGNHTPDIGGSATTRQLTRVIVDHISG